MRSIDDLFENSTRLLAQRTSRRSVIASIGSILMGTALVPLLPVDRSSARAADSGAARQKSGHAPAGADELDPHRHTASVKAATDDPLSCEYWKYCAVDGFLCSCCGGSSNTCPPGTTPSPITWIGTCRNPVDKRDYIVSYNDCCGKTSCGQCECNRNEGEKPMYRPSKNNDLNWCMANADSNYHCSVSVILGVLEQ